MITHSKSGPVSLDPSSRASRVLLQHLKQIHALEYRAWKQAHEDPCAPCRKGHMRGTAPLAE